MRPANPSNSWEEKYRILVQNDIDAPYAPRNNRGRGYGNRGQSRFGSYGPSRNDRRGGHYRGGRFGR